MLKYKGFIGHVEFDEEAQIFRGEVVNTRDIITFQGSTVKALIKAFKDSVDDYLDYCKERNEESERPFSGKFNVRIDPALHREIYIAAKLSVEGINDWLIEALKKQAND